jgi:hypothetical protein
LCLATGNWQFVPVSRLSLLPVPWHKIRARV